MITRLFAAMLAVATASIYASQPNVILIVCDDAGFADFGFQAAVTGIQSEVPTPHLDALAARGIHFTNAYAATVCSPSRAALLTGSYQNRIGYEFNIANATNRNNGWDGLPAEVTTVFERFQNLGYTTGAIGKWHVGSIPDIVVGNAVVSPGNRPPRQGVDEFFGILSGSRNYTVGNSSGVEALREMSLDSNGLEVSRILENSAPWNTTYRYVTHAFGQGALDFIERHHDGNKPFFLYVAFTAPHGPISNSPDIDDPRISHLSGKRKQYASMVITMDKEIGRIVQKLEDPAGDGSADSIADNTLVIFVNDNGGASGNGTINTPLTGWKGSVWEGGMRVPMLMAGAGITQPGTAYDQPVHVIDIAATSVAAAGGAIDDFDGVDLIPFVNGDTAGVPHAEIVVRFEFNAGVRAGPWKLVRAGNSGPFRLYDLTTDLSENNDLASTQPQVVEELQRALTRYEAGFDKARHPRGSAGMNTINLNDRFIFNPQSDTNELAWSVNQAWIDPDTSQPDTLRPIDGFAGAIVEFPATEHFSYTAINDMTRATGLDFMLNRIVLSGGSTSTRSDLRTGTIRGLPLLFVNDLSGNSPGIDLAAKDADFTYTIENELILFDDLTVGGDGDAPLVLAGTTRDFDGPRALTFSSASTVHVSGILMHGGETRVSSGTVHLGPDAAITGSRQVVVESEASLSGNGQIHGALVAEGLVAPGASIGVLSAASANLSGTLQIEIEGAESDLLAVDRTLDVTGATLDIRTLGDGIGADHYVIARFGSLAGPFAEVTGLPAGFTIDYNYGPEGNQIALRKLAPFEEWLEQAAEGEQAGLDDDLNHDGVPNGIAFLLGAPDPFSPARSLLPVVSAADGFFLFAYTRLREPGELVLIAECATSPGAWGSIEENHPGASIQITDDNLRPDEVEKVEIRLPQSDEIGPRHFFRLRIVPQS